jgi:hypothetical protein
MPTILQKNLANEIIENTKRKKPKNKKEMLVSVGYAQSVAGAKANEIIEQKGVIEALEELGFNENTAKKVVKEIMLNEKTDPNTKLKATDQVFKVMGSYKEGDKGNTFNFINVISREQKERIARRLIDGDKSSEEQSD